MIKVVEILDSDLKNMLTKLLEGQDRLEMKVSGIEARISELEAVVKKTSLKLEEIDNKIDIIVEVQAAHKEQDNRSFEKALLGQDNTNTLVIRSLQALSDDVIEIKKDIEQIKEKFDQVEKVTMQNTYDVAYLMTGK